MATDTLTVVPVPGMGAEDVLVGRDGRIYTGTEDGVIHAVSPDGQRVTRVGNTGGRPLGLEQLADGRILVCDAQRGLLALDPADESVELLAERVDGHRMLFCNNAAVHSDGTVFFSDSSSVHRLENWKADIAEDTHTGRLLRRRPNGEVDVLVEGLRFANGVALAADESFVCVAESAGRGVVRHWLTGPHRGQVDHLVTELPGYPDNIALGSDGLIWVTVAAPTNPVVTKLHRSPRLLRRLVANLPEVVQPKPRRTAHVMAFSDDGTLVHDRSFDAGGFHMVTGVREHDGRVWLASLAEPAIAWFAV